MAVSADLQTDWSLLSKLLRLAQGDGWTIVTKDRSLSAQWEHTVLVTETGYEVLSLSAGSPPIPAFVKGH